MTRKAFGERLMFAFEHSGLDLLQLAKLTEIDHSLLRKEMLCALPITESFTLPQLRQLCEVLGVSWAWLVEGVPAPGGVVAARRMRQQAAYVLAHDELDRVCDLLEAMEYA